jgi:hypothetical protein
MKQLVLALILLIAALSPTLAQSIGKTAQLNREETVALISKALTEVQSNFPSPAQSLSLEPAAVQKILKSATTQILNLRDELSDNNYIQVQSFSIDLPSGVSVQFSFPPEDRGE